MTSLTNHEGVSCDACIKSNFRGRRYKCLMCYDYDLCGNCRDAKVVSGRHTIDHPMQCILTKADLEIYYGGEDISSEQGQSFTCPYCGEMGFSENDLGDHVGLKHPNAINDVLCPICSTMVGGDPNHVTEDLMSHLATDHQPNLESSSGRTLGGGRGRYRRAPPSSSGRTREQRRVGSTVSSSGGSQSQAATARTTPRELPSFHSATAAAAAAASQSASDMAALSETSATLQQLLQQPSALASARENVDSLAELLSQLSSVRRTGTTSSSTTATAQASQAAAFSAQTASSLQQLQMQLQLERQTLFNRVDNLRNASLGRTLAGGAAGDTPQPLNARLAAAYMNAMPFGDPRQQPQQPTTNQINQNTSKSKKDREGQFLLERLMEEKIGDGSDEETPRLRANQALFVQELILETLNDAYEENSADCLIDDGVASNAATMGSSRAGSEFSLNRTEGEEEGGGGGAFVSSLVGRSLSHASSSSSMRSNVSGSVDRPE